MGAPAAKPTTLAFDRAEIRKELAGERGHIVVWRLSPGIYASHVDGYLDREMAQRRSRVTHVEVRDARHTGAVAKDPSPARPIGRAKGPIVHRTDERAPRRPNGLLGLLLTYECRA